MVLAHGVLSLWPRGKQVRRRWVSVSRCKLMDRAGRTDMDDVSRYRSEAVSAAADESEWALYRIAFSKSERKNRNQRDANV